MDIEVLKKDENIRWQMKCPVIEYGSCLMNGASLEGNENNLKKFEKLEKSSWQTQKDVITYKSSLRGQAASRMRAKNCTL